MSSNHGADDRHKTKPPDPTDTVTSGEIKKNLALGAARTVGASIMAFILKIFT